MGLLLQVWPHTTRQPTRAEQTAPLERAADALQGACECMGPPNNEVHYGQGGLPTSVVAL
jgi:hypothetical protein